MMTSAVNASNLTKDISAKNSLDKLIPTSNPHHAPIILVPMVASVLSMGTHSHVPAGNLDLADLNVRS